MPLHHVKTIKYKYTVLCSPVYKVQGVTKISKFLCGHRKGHSPFLTLLGSVYTYLCVVTSAHTLLGPFILILRLILCLDQLYSCTVILLSSVNLYDILLLLVHALCLAQFAVQIDTTYTHSWCTHFAWISCTATHLYFIPASVNSWTVYTTSLYNCTLASASLASVLSTNHRRASIYLLRSDWSIRRPRLILSPP